MAVFHSTKCQRWDYIIQIELINNFTHNFIISVYEILNQMRFSVKAAFA